MIIGKAISPFALRKKNGIVPTDPDAQLFITATGISGTNATATNKLVIDLKAANIWTKMKAVYPFVGNTASSQKFNLKDARDLNAAYRLVFSGGGTFSSNGYLPNGINSFADTFLIPSVDMAGKQNNMSISAYIRTNNNGNYVDIGNSTLGYFNMSILMPRTTDTLNGGINTNANSNVANTDSRGFFMIKRTSSSAVVYQKNSTFTSRSNTSSGLANVSFYVGAMHEGTNTVSYSVNQCAFASIGDGLTDAEATALYNAVQLFNTTLGRQV